MGNRYKLKLYIRARAYHVLARCHLSFLSSSPSHPSLLAYLLIITSWLHETQNVSTHVYSSFLQPAERE